PSSTATWPAQKQDWSLMSMAASIATFWQTRAKWLPAGLLVGLGLVAWPVWSSVSMRAPSPPPRAPLKPLPESPFKNTRLDVKYVGDQECKRCHAKRFDEYRAHPMGQSLFAASEAPQIEVYHARANNPFTFDGLHYQARREGNKLFHKVWLEDSSG